MNTQLDFEARYYFSIDGTEVLGPCSIEELKSDFLSDALPVKTLVCAEKSDKWQLLASVLDPPAPKESAQPPRGPQPATNKLYTLWIDKKKAGPFTLVQLSEMWLTGAVTRQTSYWNDSTSKWRPFLEISKTLPTHFPFSFKLSQPSQQSDDRINITELYTLWINKKKAGPYTLGELHKMYVWGDVTEETPYWSDGRKKWQPLAEIRYEICTATPPPTHIPYCYSCGKSVSPNVVNRTTQGVGMFVPTEIGIGLYRANSTSELIKVCPHCGGRVQSEDDREMSRRVDAEIRRDGNRTTLIVCGIILVFVTILIYIVNK